LTTEPVPRCEFEPDKLLVRFTATIKADVDAIQPIVGGVMQIIRESTHPKDRRKSTSQGTERLRKAGKLTASEAFRRMPQLSFPRGRLEGLAFQPAPRPFSRTDVLRNGEASSVI
jgi:hypothetical protein